MAPVERRLSGFIKRLGLQRTIPVAAGMHRVEDVLRLAAVLGIEPVAELVAPQGGERIAPDSPYAVIHAAPMFRYKRWTRDGWRALAAALVGRGLAIVATGGPADAERRYLDDLWDGIEVRRADGRSWPELATLLAGARIYVGPDTSVTHLAAACGLPDGRPLRADRPAAVGALAGRRACRALGSRGHGPAPRQCLARAERAPLHALPAGGLRAASRKPQPVPR